MAELEVPETMHVENHEEQVPEQEPQEGERQPTQRELTMRAIAEKAEQRRQEELAQARIYDEEARAAGMAFPEDELEPEPEPEPVEQTPVQEPQPQEAASQAQQSLRKVTFDGREFEVTDQQYDELAKMGMLANVALHQYNQQPPPTPQQPVQQPAQPQPQQVIDPELVKQTVRKIQYGGEEDGAEALTQLVSHVVSRVPQAPQIDQNQIIQQAAAVAQQQAQFARDQEIIQREYKDVFADPQRTMLARLNVDAIRQRNAATGKYNVPDIEVFREAGNMVLDALNLPRPNVQDEKAAIQAAPVMPRQGVIERKRAAPRQTTTQVDRRAPAPQTPRPPTGSEVVEQMRKARGQASMM